MRRFIAKENIHHLADQFGFTADAEKRNALVRLLVEEEDKLGRGLENLEIADRRIAIANVLIRKQELLIERYAMQGYDTSIAKELLRSILVSKSLFETFRHQIVHEIGGNGL